MVLYLSKKPHSERPEGLGEKISHPSPANPSPNRGWAELTTKQLGEIGVDLNPDS